MFGRLGCAAIFAALLVAAAGSARAQDVTLTSRDGALEISGRFLGFDGAFYRIDTAYGPLTVDSEAVICDGPACPGLTAPKAVVRIAGMAEAGTALLPPLLAAFARARGLVLTPAAEPGAPNLFTDPDTGEVLGEFTFQAAEPGPAREALTAGAVELMLASNPVPGLNSKAFALDVLVPIVAPDNPLPRLSTVELARALTGEVTNWAELGGPDMPLVLHGLAPDAGPSAALAARLGRDVAATEVHADLASLAAAVARDPWALAVTGRATAAPARILPLTDSCGFPLLPHDLAVKAEDYPLTLPLLLLTPKRRLPLMAREFLEFLSLPEAQAVVQAAGYVDRLPERQPMTDDGLRLLNAIRGAGEETTLADLQRLALVMDGADRLSFTFRFEDGAAGLDATSRENLEDLARLMEAGMFKGEALILAGFSDGTGGAAENLALSRERTEAVLASLRDLAPTLTETQLPRIEAFGEALPMACDETPAGRRLNRRVELWVTPDFGRTATAAPESGN